MTAVMSPRSLAPALPPRAAAQARIRALQADLAAATDATARAALEHELGALHEVRMGDPDAAYAHYEAATQADPRFLPGWLARARHLRARGTLEADQELASALDAAVDATSDDTWAASLLVEQGVLREDRLVDPVGARACYERALARDPDHRAALVMLERSARAEHDVVTAQETTSRRVERTRDATLRATLRLELAEAAVHTARLDDALAHLQAASEQPQLRFEALTAIARVAKQAGRGVQAAQAHEALAQLLADHGASAELGDRVRALAERPDAALLRAAHLREAGRAYAACDDDAASRRVYDEAAQLAPDDLVIALEQLEVLARSEDVEAARVLAERLLERAHGDAARSATLCFQLAEIASRAGNLDAARGWLARALAYEPLSPATLAVLEDQWIDTGAFGALCDHLELQAERLSGAEREAAQLRAAGLASDRLADPARALRLLRGLEQSGQPVEMVLRETYGVALRAGDGEAQQRAGHALLARALDDAEAGAILRECYEAQLATQAWDAAATTLERALLHAGCAAWAAPCAVVFAARRGDHRLLASAHAALASRARDAQEAELAAAHGCAQARALWRAGDADAALAEAQRALTLSPGHAYAVALVEELLIARGDATDAAHVLREAAAAVGDAHASELALLHAGAAAELAGRDELAAQSYEEAVERDPNALAPLWALRRLAERTGNAPLALAALEGLAAREAALDAPGAASVELAERYDAIDKLDLVAQPLTAAIEATPTIGAGVLSLLLPPRTLAAAPRERALAVLQSQLGDAGRAFVARERVGDALSTDPPLARGLLDALAAANETAIADSLARYLLAIDAPARTRALAETAERCEDPDTRSELVLHARRTLQLFEAAPHHEAEHLAFEAALRDPATLASAISLDETCAPGGEAIRRADALTRRLEHAGEQASPTLRLTLARALLDADNFAGAAEIAREMLRAEPRELGAWEVLRGAARGLRQMEDVVLACDTLAHHASGELQALLYEEAATVLEDDLSRPSDAEIRLRAALAADPRRSNAFERLHDLLVSRHDIEGLVELLSSRVALAVADGELSDLLYEQARLLRALGERDAALACAEEVLGRDAEHAGALGLCAEIHASQKDWQGAVEALQRLAQCDVPKSQRKLARQGAADFLERNLGDLAGAYRELAEVVREGLGDLAVWKRMAEVAQRAQLWNEAVGALGHAAQLSHGVARAALERRAGAILARDAAHHEAARQAYGRALGAAPLDIDACEALSTLIDGGERTSLLATFTAAVLGALSREPGNAEHLRALRRVARLSDDRTLEHVALGTLHTLDLATLEESDVFLQLDAHVPACPNESLSDEQLAVLHEARVPQAAWAIARLASKAWLELRADAPARHGVTRHDRIGKPETHAVGTLLTPWAASFGLRVSERYVGGEDARALTMIATRGHAHAWVIGRDVTPPLRARQRFDVAAQCAAMRLQVAPLVMLERTAARDLLEAASLVASENGASHASEAVRNLREGLARQLSRAERRELATLFATLPDASRALDAVVDDARSAALRAGLLACCDLRTSLATLLGERFEPALLSSSTQATALLRFWTSSTLVTLRRELGLGL